MHRDLLIVRAGPESLHESWHELDRRAFDLALSCYGGRPHVQGLPCFSDPGGKWEALHALRMRAPELFASRRAIAVFDDDLFVTVDSLNALFAFRENRGLAVAQLSVKGHVTQPITAPEPECAYRLTNFTEVMAPCFSRECFEKLLPWFSGKRFGWGLDFVWDHVARSMGGQGILDSHVMVHTRPQGTGSLYACGNPEEEARKTIRESGFRVVTPTVLERGPLPRSSGQTPNS